MTNPLFPQAVKNVELPAFSKIKPEHVKPAVEQAITEIGQVVEGYRNTKEVYNLAQRVGVEMPITEQIYQVLYQGKDVKDAAMSLLGREKKAES